jgi:hypothetical protein
VVQLAEGGGAEILSIQNFWGLEILEFLALKIFAKSFSPSCGAPCSKGLEFSEMKISGGPEIPHPGRNFRLK